MSTIKQILDRVDSQRPNDFEPHMKVRWLSELEGRLALNLYNMDRSELQQFQYQCPGDLEKELLVDFPYDEIYYYWLCARIDAEHGETNRYQNSIEFYNSCYSELLGYLASRYVDGCGCSKGFFISAYGLAVKQGFSGDLDSWLRSLVGPQGPQGVPGAKIRIGAVHTLQVGENARAQIGGTPEDPVLDLWIPAGTTKVVKRTGDVMEGDLDMSGYILRGLPTSAEGYGGEVSEDCAVSAGALPELLDKYGLQLMGSTANLLGGSYGKTTFLDIENGAYFIEGEMINGINEGLIVVHKLKSYGAKDEPTDSATGFEYLFSGDGKQIWMRIHWRGQARAWQQLNFGYGDGLPENGVEGQLYFVEG